MFYFLTQNAVILARSRFVIVNSYFFFLNKWGFESKFNLEIFCVHSFVDFFSFLVLFRISNLVFLYGFFQNATQREKVEHGTRQAQDGMRAGKATAKHWQTGLLASSTKEQAVKGRVVARASSKQISRERSTKHQWSLVAVDSSNIK
jgi:hypothetical protein